MRTTLYIIALFITTALSAQNNIANLLMSIEENNVDLKALREETKALKLKNRTDITLSNPELEFNYLWPKQKGGVRKDFKLSQNFDFPTLVGMKGRLANEQNSLVDLQYNAQRIEILLEAKLYCVDLIYCNALKKELEFRKKHAITIAEGYKERLDSGDANILEYNKVQLNLAAVQGEMARLDIEMKSLLSSLKRLNGGVDFVFEDDKFELFVLPESFEEWFANKVEQSVLTQQIRQELKVSQKELSLSKAMRLPSFNLGYMSEQIPGHAYHGLSMGIAIPLWENRNKVKQARQAVHASELRQDSRQGELFSRFQALYERTAQFYNLALNYRSFLIRANSTELLKKALDAGEISLLEYIVEIGLYFDTIKETLEAERDFQKAYAELYAIEL